MNANARTARKDATHPFPGKSFYQKQKHESHISIMRLKFIVVGAGLGVITMAAAAGYWWSHRYLESTNNAYIRADISPVIAKVEGYVRSVNVRDNASVKAGDVLIQVDDREYQARRTQLEAAVSAKAATMVALKQREALQLARITEAHANVVASQVVEKRAQFDADRFINLGKQNFVSQQKVESVQAEADQAHARVQAEIAQRDAENAALREIQSQYVEAKARLDEARAQLSQIALDQANTVLRAPVAGLIGNRTVQVGQLVRPGTQLLAVVPPESAYILANFKETQITRMQPGQAVRIKIDAYPGIEFTGSVDSLSPASGAQFSLLPQDNATGNFTKIVQRVPVRIRVNSPAQYKSLLRAGLSVEVVVDTRPSGA
ncbi:HlyD family secretion protein [Chromobacterium haemolyticum]|uniref:HlyD family secretion protein n=1 Tax=Chromobacterium haemolyticum TaxID=394935 RepID=UPI00244C258A|nr:HlyD family secretion protein [Chromobacterium haemolyticum]MDH0342099.1 HlyD family secretion protein [Chromobacterium haemolyticum]